MPLSRIKVNSVSPTGNVVTNLIKNEGNQIAFRNRITNGNMIIDQRNGGASLSITGYYQFPVDRFHAWQFTGSTFSTMQQKNGDGPVGFSNYLRTTTTSTFTSFGSGVGYSLRHVIEGSSISDFGWGSSGASPVTLSFWVRSSVTGTYCVSIRSTPVAYGYTAEYTINQANTWEYKTIVVPGPTANGTTAFPVTNISSVDIVFVMGSNQNAVANTWKGDSLWATTNQTNMFATNGSTFDITGIQLEKGSVATAFEHRPYGMELQLCQRYYWTLRSSQGNQTNFNIMWFSGRARCTITTPVTMRSNPTVSLTGSTSGAFFSTNDDSNYRNFTYSGAYTEQGSGVTCVALNFTDGGGGASATGGGTAYIQNLRTLEISSEM